MKTIKTKDGQVIKGYELQDLDTEAREKVIREHAEFMGSLDYTEYPDEDEVIENLEINGYLFNDEGELYRILTYTGKNNEVLKHVFGKKEIECTIEEEKP